LKLNGQLRKYFDEYQPYNATYFPDHDTPYFWWNSIVDGRSSLSRLAKTIFSITPHSASCERLFSALGWLFGKKRVNLNVKTVESMAKIYCYNLSNNKNNLNHINDLSNDEVQKMLNIVFEEGDLLNENDEEEFVFEEEELEDQLLPRQPPQDEKLEIEQLINLGPWVLIDNTVLPNVNRQYNDSNCDDWDPDEMINDN
jgi:hAT family C-terminal dimerisation region